MKKLLLGWLVLGSVLCVAQVPTAVLGTWRLDNITKVTGGQPVKLSLQNGTYNCASCQPSPVTIPADGKMHPISGGGPYDQGKVTVVDQHTVKFQYQKNGKVVSDETATVSADGKTLKRTQKDDKGENSTATLKRISGPPSGANAISGEWQVLETETSQPMVVTYKKGSDGGLAYQDSTGSNYDAKLDGNSYEVKGPEAGKVSVKSSGPRSLQEDFKDDKGKTVLISKTEVSSDGKHATIDNTSQENGRTFHFKATKQQ